MPRLACRECRARKAKCIFLGSGKRCERCADRNLGCSLANSSPVMSPARSQTDRLQAHLNETVPILPNNRRRPVHKWPSTFSSSVYSIPDRYQQVEHIQGDYVIGGGTPGEILREAELSKDIIRLFFEHFSDVNFLFDQESLIRDFELGEVPQVILYPMLALGIRFSEAPFFEGTMPCHRGEALVKHGRNLLKDDFDHVSLHSIQAYILQCTYWLVFGAARKAWLYLGIASTMSKSLRLSHSPLHQDAHRTECCRRIVCNLVFLDRILSPSFNMQCHFSLVEEFAEPDSWKGPLSATGRPSIESPLSHRADFKSEIFHLSLLLGGLCTYHRRGEQPHNLDYYERQHLGWEPTLQGDLGYSPNVYSKYRDKGTLRRFLFMHLLHNHIGQLLYFPALGGDGPEQSMGANSDRSRAALSQYYAGRISDIVEEAWMKGGITMHNTCCGQMLTISAAVHMYSCLTSDSAAQKAAARASIDVILQAFVRMKRYSRIFDRMSTQLNTFFQIFNQNNAAGTVFDGRTRLLGRIMHYGTYFELSNQRSSNEHSPSPQETVLDASSAAQQAAPSIPQNEFQSLDFLMSGYESVDRNPERFDWLFTEASLQDLYCMAYMDSDALMANY